MGWSAAGAVVYARLNTKAVAQALQAQADRFFALIPHHLAVVPPAVPPVESPVPDPDIRRALRPTSPEREQHVLRLLGQGHTPPTISQSLGLNLKTVSTYQRRLMGKLNLATTSQLRRFAIEQETDRSRQPTPLPVLAPAVVVPMATALVPIAYRSQSYEREEWPG